MNKARQQNALVIGASGGIGQALVQSLLAMPAISRVFAISRQPLPADLNRPNLTWMITRYDEPAIMANIEMDNELSYLDRAGKTIPW
jgi:uncharacterized protein YbjT (DUF2867 family)